MAKTTDAAVVRDYLAQGVTATGAKEWVPSSGDGGWTFHGIVSGTGAVTATIAIEVSNDGVNACATPLGTITLSGTTTASDGFANSAPWAFVRANVTAITGTGATVNVIRGR